MEIPYFIRLLTQNKLIVSTIKARSIGEIDLQGIICDRIDNNSIELQDFELNGEEYFRSVSILITRYGTLIDFISTDTKYFDESIFYFNSSKTGRITRLPKRAGFKNYEVKSKIIGDFELFEGSLRATVFTSKFYGSKIMLSYQK